MGKDLVTVTFTEESCTIEEFLQDPPARLKKADESCSGPSLGLTENPYEMNPYILFLLTELGGETKEQTASPSPSAGQGTRLASLSSRVRVNCQPNPLCLTQIERSSATRRKMEVRAGRRPRAMK